MKKFLQYHERIPDFSESGTGITSDPLLPQHLRFHCGSRNKSRIKIPSIHGRYLFRFQLAGETTLNVDDINYLTHPGDAILIPPGARLFFTPSPDAKILNAAFELPAKELRLRRVCKYVFRLSAKDKKFLDDSVSAFFSWLDGDAASAGEAVLSFAALLNRIQHLDIQKNISISGDDEQSPLTGRIVEYLAANRDHRVTLKELARVMHLSGSTIRQTFQAKMGIPVGRYELYRRLHYSLELLRSTDLTVHEIANKCGFSSANGLYRALRREKSDGPAKIRKKFKTAKFIK